MSDPLFDSRTARHDFPLLFAGQAQKEGFVNEALTRVDALLHGAVEAELAAPPAAPAEGQCWLVGQRASGAWNSHAGKIAAYAGGNWLFFAPRDGMHVLNRATGQYIRFMAGWKAPGRPGAPTGGTTIDNEARKSLLALFQSLTEAGVLPAA